MLNAIGGLSMKFLWFSVAEGLLGLILLVLSPLWDNRFTVRWKKYLWCVLAATLLIGPFLPAPQLKILKFGIGANDSAIDRYPQNNNQVNPTEPAGSDVNDVTVNPPALSTNPTNPGISVDSVKPGSPADSSDIAAPDVPGTLPEFTDPAKEDTLPQEETDTNAIYRMLPKIIRVFAVIWLMGAALFAAYIFVKEYIFRDSLKRQTQPVCNEETVNIYKSVCREMGINEKMAPKLLAWSDANGPMLAGLFCPKLIMPAEFESMQLNEPKSENSESGVKYGDELYYILKHELTHFIGKDLWLKALFLAVNVLHWFNPIVWLICRKANQDIELACDERVLGKLDLNARRIYGEILLLTARKQNRYLAALSTELSGGARVIRDRIKNVFTLNKRKGIIPAAICCLVIFIISLTACITVPKNITEPSPSSPSDSVNPTESKGSDVKDSAVNPTVPKESSGQDTQKQEQTAGITPVINYTMCVTGNDCILGVNTAGKIVVNGGQSVLYTEGTEEWENLVSVVSWRFTEKDGYPSKEEVIGLTKDGRLYSKLKSLNYVALNVTLTDVAMISAKNSDFAALKKDGTVYFLGTTHVNQADWKNIIQVSVGNNLIVGLKSDKTVIANGNNEYGQCNVSDWTDIEMVAAGVNHTVGLRSDGSVVATGLNLFGECDLSEWKDIVYIAADLYLTVGVKADGSVLTAGRIYDCQYKEIEEWTNMVYVSIGKYGNVIAGLTKNGELRVCDLEYGKITKSSDFLIPTVNITIDGSKRLAAVKQKFIEFDRVYSPENVLLPENRVIKTKYGFELKLDESVVDKVLYTCDEKTGSITIYSKNDVEIEFRENDVLFNRVVAATFSRESVNEAIRTLMVIGHNMPEWFAGGETAKEKINIAFHDMAAQICSLGNLENVYEDIIFINENGDMTREAADILDTVYYKENGDIDYVDSSEFFKAYEKYRTQLRPEDDYVYTFTTAIDSWPSLGGKEFNDLKDWFTENLGNVIYP